MFFIALTLYGIFIIGYGIFAAALLYHIYTFSIPEDPLHAYIIPFVAVSLVLVAVSLYFFLQIPWNTLSI